MAHNHYEGKKVNDQYFTRPETVEWCFQVLSEHYNLQGKTALEPACGGGIFLTVANSLGLGIQWTTNDLFPQEGSGVVPDHQIDFAKDPKFAEVLGQFDLVITNPPFGNSSWTAKRFITRAIEVGTVVAMILPKGCRRGNFIDTLPEDVRVVEDRMLEDRDTVKFVLPDGSTKAIGCVFMVFERVPSYVRKKRCEYFEEGYTGKKGDNQWPDWATHHVPLQFKPHCGRLYARAGRYKDRGGLDSYYVQLTDEQAAKLEGFHMDEWWERTQTTFPGLSWYEVRTALNQALRGEETRWKP